MNQSALERRIVRGMKYSSTCWEESSVQILLSDSTAWKTCEQLTGGKKLEESE